MLLGRQNGLVANENYPANYWVADWEHQPLIMLESNISPQQESHPLRLRRTYGPLVVSIVKCDCRLHHLVVGQVLWLKMVSKVQSVYQHHEISYITAALVLLCNRKRIGEAGTNLSPC